jgi:hypothetical protein
MFRLAPLRQAVQHLQMNGKFYHGVKGVGHLSDAHGKLFDVFVRHAPVSGRRLVVSSE